MWTLFIAIFSTLVSANAYKILFFAPSLGKSHLIFQSRIADAIAKAGHEVVMFEPEYHYDPEALPGAKFAERYILRGLREKVNISDDYGEILTDAFADMTMLQNFQVTRGFQRRLVPTCEEIIKRTDVIEDLRKRKFDAYISEPFGCDNGFAHLIGISTYIMLTSPTFPSTQSLFRNASLIFVNTDEFVDFPRPTQDNVVNIGGIGLDQKNDTLEEPFKSQAKLGKLGSVVITFGTHIPTETLPIPFKRNLVTALVSLPNYHFIVRVDKGDLATMKSWLGVAKNVYFTDWTPQAALLHDTNVVAFVSHMGANSLMEAAYNGKAVLCMPFAFDQNRNCRLAVRNGWAKYFSRTELLDGPDTFKAAIIDLLEGESGAGYRANAARVKQLIKNKPLSSEERLRKYIHLLEVGGGRLPELQHYSRNMSLWAFYSLDIWIPLIIGMMTFIYGFTKFLMWLYGKMLLVKRM
ncbi:UDP-glucoronosyl and UDP-glucosyl transferase domain-containing protein [Ditylenchus destructor]|uniref:glucuronosyltransferase n=1 Tax=Ditylenchus destructor TaxID=166010 RepID=A0AAD4N1H4_9BILA|nr:UDP-glucoronosyl and UDP-glucosyl transferase domain-containing protein [Ditylenchus destructor]